MQIMLKVIKYRKEHRNWQRQHDDAAPKVGDSATDFELCDIHGEHSIKLSDFYSKKPVVLIFGSYT